MKKSEIFVRLNIFLRFLGTCTSNSALSSNTLLIYFVRTLTILHKFRYFYVLVKEYRNLKNLNVFLGKCVGLYFCKFSEKSKIFINVNYFYDYWVKCVSGSVLVTANVFYSEN